MDLGGQSQSKAALPAEKEPPVPKEDGRTPQLVWASLRRDKSLTPAGIGTMNLPTRILVKKLGGVTRSNSSQSLNLIYR
jgi:hypothetical protein